MAPAPIPLPVQASALDLARRVGLIMAGLAALVAHRFLRDPRFKTLVIPLWTRITRAATRFTRLMARLAANRPPRSRPTRGHHKTPGAALPAAPPAALPSGYGWLIGALQHEGACYASQLEALLAEPGVADLLAACPQAARILRPIGRMLGLTALAPRRSRPTRRAAPPSADAARARPKPPPPFARHPPNAKWPHRPSADWASAYRRRRAKPA